MNVNVLNYKLISHGVRIVTYVSGVHIAFWLYWTSIISLFYQCYTILSPHYIENKMVFYTHDTFQTPLGVQFVVYECRFFDRYQVLVYQRSFTPTIQFELPEECVRAESKLARGYTSQCTNTLVYIRDPIVQNKGNTHLLRGN